MAVAEEIQRNLTGDSGRQEDVDQGADDGAVDSIETKDPYMPQAFGGSGIPLGVNSPRKNIPGNNEAINAQFVRDAKDRLEGRKNPRPQIGLLAIRGWDWTA